MFLAVGLPACPCLTAGVGVVFRPLHCRCTPAALSLHARCSVAARRLQRYCKPVAASLHACLQCHCTPVCSATATLFAVIPQQVCGDMPARVGRTEQGLREDEVAVRPASDHLLGGQGSQHFVRDGGLYFLHQGIAQRVADEVFARQQDNPPGRRRHGEGAH